MENLNQKQKEAVESSNEPVLVVAGAGAGKTKVITERIKRLIESGTAPESILAVTFTNKAAEEMKTRIGDRGQGIGTSPFVGTFHQLGLLIIKENTKTLGMGRNPTILDEDDSLSLIKESEKDLGINPKEFDHGKFKNQMSKMKNSLVSAGDFEERSFWGENFKRTWELYERKKKNQNMLDFDDLLILPVKLLQQKEDILKNYQSRWQFIHIDEYQDTNKAQYALSKLLAASHRNIFAVGDIDQAIYSWRGADFRNVLNFQKDYAEAKIITLEQNYRSTDIILEAANAVILNNKMRLPKNLVAERRGSELIRAIYGINERDEARKIAEEILQSGGRGYNDIAILYRTNAQSRALEEAMLTYGIPYKVVGGFRFYERREIKDILGYLRLMQNPADTISKRRILNIPPRGIGKTLALKIMSGIKDLNNSEAQKIKEFESLIESLRTKQSKNTFDTIQNLIKSIKYREFIDDGTEKGAERWQNVQELLTIAKEQTIENFLEHVSLFSADDKGDPSTPLGAGKVTLMTAHMAKGLEFEAVFIAGLEEGLFPHALSISPEEIEEERRLFYVALTRAKTKLYVTLTSQRTIFGNTNMAAPSRFLGEIPKHLIAHINKPNYYEMEENIYVE
ncbi:MAG: UvrD-helicase domain-containing protein [Patescibacteria group bacterium]